MKYFKAIIYSLLLNAGILSIGSAQKYYEKKQAVIPASPNTAAIEKFVDYPVSLFTGVPEISVPIYTINLKKISVPISVSYHSGGVKVDDVASNIGMGWSLNAGGVISIQANGIMDEISGFGYQHSKYSKVKNNTLQTWYPGGNYACSIISTAEDLMYLYSGGDIDYLRNIQYQSDDSEPDIYTYSFNGKGGKFFQDENGVFRTIPFSKIKIERLHSGSTIVGYEITDIDGTKYQFQKREETTINTTNICSPNSPATTTYGRSYYLTKIISVYGDEINFHYSGNNFQYYSQTQFSRSIYLTPGCNQYNINGGYASNCASNSNMLTGSWKIDSITATNGARIIFGYSIQDRSDLAGTKSLKEIAVKTDIPNETIDKFEFTQDYWYSRLRLISLKQNGKPAYQFFYNQTAGGTNRLSYSQDHWGYFNGAYNSTLLPVDEYNGLVSGADRAPNANYVAAGILNKIIYPTGGYTEYFYEPNEYYEDVSSTVQNKVTGASLASQPDQIVTTSFTVPANSSRHHLIMSNTYDGTNTNGDYCVIKIYNTTGFNQQFVGTSSFKSIALQPGTYTLEIENVGTQYSASASVVWFNAQVISPHNEIGGGVRIKEIRAYEAANANMYVKKFEYKQPGSTNSSGKIMYRPLYSEVRNEARIIPASDCYTNSGSTSCDLLTQSSNSLTPLGYSSGYQVGYSDVVVYVKSKTENGYSSFKYLIDNSNSISQGLPSVPYAPIVNFDWVNGTLTEQIDYKYNGASFEPVKKIKRDYNYNSFNKDNPGSNTFIAYGGKLMMISGPQVSGRCNFGCVNDILSDINFGYQPFKLYSSWHYLTKEEETLFSSSTSIKNTTEYIYNSAEHIQPSKIIRYSSNGGRSEILIKYPLDFTGLTATDDITAGVINLKNKNIISAEVEKTGVVNNLAGSAPKIISSQLNVYGGLIPTLNQIKGIETNTAFTNFSSSSVLNGAISYDQKYKDQIGFKFNSSGSMIEVQKNTDLKNSYLWDAKQNYPICEVVNAPNTEIFHDNFEDLTGWDGSLTTYDNSKSKTGKYSGRIDKPTAGEQTSHSTKWLSISLTAQKKFRYSTWVFSTGPSAEIFLFMKRANEPNYFSYVTSVTTNETNKWVLVEADYIVPADVTQLGIRLDNNGGGTVWFDDVRLHPSDAMMTTYTYKPLVGMTSQTDVNNKSTYYEYDSFNRLSIVRDQDGKILKKICYNYAGQPEDCGSAVFTNVVKSGNFTKNNCGAGGTGSSVTYTVVEGTYSASTQFAADSLAQAAVYANGQAYANTNGTCVFSSYDYSGYYYSELCSGGSPTGVYVYAPAGMFTSTISLQDANNQAYQYAQNYANTYGSCTSLVDIMGFNYSYDNFYVTMTNLSTNEEFFFFMYENTTEGIGMVPPGNYNIQIDSWGDYHSYSVFCGNYSGGFSAFYYNITVDASCNDIQIY